MRDVVERRTAFYELSNCSNFDIECNRYLETYGINGIQTQITSELDRSAIIMLNLSTSIEAAFFNKALNGVFHFFIQGKVHKS